MLFKADDEIQVARRPTPACGFTLTGEPDFLALAHALRDADFVGLDMRMAVAAERDFLFRAMQGLFDRHQQVGFDIVAARGLLPAVSREALAATAKRAAAEELLEKIREPCAGKAASIGEAAVASAAAAPAGRGLRPAVLPVRAELVVAPALFGIAEDFVGLVDLLEFRLGGLLLLGDIGMILPGELAKGFANLVLRGGFGHTESRVIILVLNGHNDCRAKIIIRRPRASLLVTKSLQPRGVPGDEAPRRPVVGAPARAFLLVPARGIEPQPAYFRKDVAVARPDRHPFAGAALAVALE